MSELNQIPYLIQLLDDDSPEIRNRVIRQLTSFGPNLREELKKIELVLNPSQQETLYKIIEAQKRNYLKRLWPTWYPMKNDCEMLEVALSLLAGYLNESEPRYTLKILLDNLAMGYRRIYRNRSPVQLAHFLFQEHGIEGAENDYYNPQNSNLIYVLESKKGIPISLASIFMLVGHRLDIPIRGCNFPGHFLTRVAVNGQNVFIDCFNSGQIIERVEVEQIKDKTGYGFEDLLKEKTDAPMMIKRFLANLINIYQMGDDSINSGFLISLYNDLDFYLAQKQLSELTPDQIISQSKPVLRRGMIIRHHCGYRGIIVEIDSSCAASDSWYYSNQIQPDRNQPWYHILVHGTDQVTYAAESHLVPDDSCKKIDHPLLLYFFDEGKGGRYIRNNTFWPDAEI